MNHFTTTLNKSNLSGRMSKLYILALSVIAMLTITGYFLIQWALYQQNSNAHVINIAGRQRMLSESISKTALLIQITTDTDKRLKQVEKLTTGLDLLERSHYGLQKGSADIGLSGQNSMTVIGLFTEMQANYQAMKTAAQQVLTSIAQNVSDSAHSVELSALVEHLVTEQAYFVQKMDAIVSQYETEALAQLNQVKQIAFILAALIFIVLLLEGWYLFRPAVRQLEQTLQRLVTIERFQEQKTLLQTILDYSPSAIYVKDLQDRYILINRVVENVLKRNRKEIIGKTGDELLPKPIADQFYANDLKVIEAKSPLKFDEAFSQDDGLHHYISIKFPLYDVTGEPYAICGISTDITEHQQMKKALCKSEAMCKTVLNAIPESAFFIDNKGIVLSANETAALRLGTTLDKLVGANADDFLSSALAEKSKAENGFQNAKPIRFEEVCDDRYLDNLIYPVVTEGERPLKIALLSFDITEHAQFEICTLNEKLEQRVVQRTTQLEASALKAELASCKQANVALQASENQFRTLTEMMAAATFICHDEKMLYINPAATVITGYSQTELLKMSLREIVHPDFKHKVEEFCLASQREEQEPQSYEFKILTQQGQERWIDWSGRLIEYQGKTVILVTAFDITARKQADLQFRQLLESAPDAMVIVNEQGRIVIVNAQTEKLFGYQRTALLGQPLEILIPERLRTTHHDHKTHYFNHPDRRPMGIGLELYALRHDGSEFPVEISLSPIETADRFLVSSTIRDITERKQTEDTLRNIVEGVSPSVGSWPTFLKSLVLHLAKTLQVKHVFIALISADAPNKMRTLFVVADNQFIENVEYDLCHTPCEKIVQEKTLCRYPQNVQEAFPLDTGLREMGIESYFGTPLFNANDSVVGLMTIMDTKPISHQKQVESILPIFAARASAELERIQALEALQQERASLAQRVKERTAELSLANAQLARAARLKDEFLANMSHELRTPLNAVLGMTEVLQEGIYGPINQQQTKSIDTIEESGRHLLSLINDILDLAKIEAGKVRLEMNPFSVQGVCQACLRFIKESAYKKRIKTSTVFDSSVTIIQADERYLKQILLNLLSNAIKFTPQGGKVNLEVRGHLKQGVVDFIVSDTGRGIAEKDMDSLFKPFVQLDGGLSRTHEGTGLGLSLVYRLTELHGGSVSVSSELGKGSHFTVSLPWEENTVLSATAIEPFNAELPTKSLLSEAVILLVDDNPSIIETLSDYLTIKGYSLITAYNGIQAIEKTRAEKPDLILMDIQMPGMDGLEAIRRIRADAEVATIPIIAITALAMPGDEERCLEAGAQSYLSKPLSFKGLVEEIEALLS
ncbi:MAG: PAS domain S-box protein [Candidatus Parabeggiatoa sp.]|nr:PAS domain S-box protein [Candidatus Parabeggiatoa sp.]